MTAFRSEWSDGINNSDGVKPRLIEEYMSLGNLTRRLTY
jgi:hypothetical protein